MVDNENIKIEQEVLNSYKIANDFAIHMDKSIWTRFNTLLVVNGLILVFWRNIDDEILSHPPRPPATQ